jgi:hypothetical protein
MIFCLGALVPALVKHIIHLQSHHMFHVLSTHQIFGGLAYTRGGQGGKVERLYREVRCHCLEYIGVKCNSAVEVTDSAVTATLSLPLRPTPFSPVRSSDSLSEAPAVTSPGARVRDPGRE